MNTRLSNIFKIWGIAFNLFNQLIRKYSFMSEALRLVILRFLNVQTHFRVYTHKKMLYWAQTKCWIQGLDPMLRQWFQIVVLQTIVRLIVLFFQISLSVWSPHTVEQSIQQHCLPFLQLATLASSLYYNTDLPDTQVGEGNCLKQQALQCYCRTCLV